jgi:hypothetical protein
MTTRDYSVRLNEVCSIRDVVFVLLIEKVRLFGCFLVDDNKNVKERRNFVKKQNTIKQNNTRRE